MLGLLLQLQGREPTQEAQPQPGGPGPSEAAAPEPHGGSAHPKARLAEFETKRQAELAERPKESEAAEAGEASSICSAISINSSGE